VRDVTIGSVRFGLPKSMTRALAPVFLCLQPLLYAIDPAIELIQPLRVSLSLPGRCLCFGECLLRRAISLLQPRFQPVDALANGSDLLAHIGFGRTPAEAEGADEDHDRRGKFRHRWGHRVSSNS
jgi:hypothetical protein